MFALFFRDCSSPFFTVPRLFLVVPRLFLSSCRSCQAVDSLSSQVNIDAT
jgi:hypothetical protein